MQDSDGTVYFSYTNKSAGLRTTTAACLANKKPYIINPSVEELCSFIEENDIKILNVAGNRGSKIPLENLEEFKNRLKEALKKNGE